MTVTSDGMKKLIEQQSEALKDSLEQCVFSPSRSNYRSLDGSGSSVEQ